MNVYLFEAHQELKRLDHIIWVSLKYTRTVDVILNGVKKLVDVYDLIIEGLLINKGLDNLPKSPALRAIKVKQLYEEDNTIIKNMDFYNYLKLILKSEYTKREEYRRHVTQVVDLGKMTSEMDIDMLGNCEKYITKFWEYCKQELEVN